MRFKTQNMQILYQIIALNWTLNIDDTVSITWKTPTKAYSKYASDFPNLNTRKQYFRYFH